MVMDDDVAERGGNDDRGHGVTVPPGQRLHLHDELRFIGPAEEEDFIAPCILDLTAQLEQGFFSKVAVHRHGRYNLCRGDSTEKALSGISWRRAMTTAAVPGTIGRSIKKGWHHATPS